MVVRLAENDVWFADRRIPPCVRVIRSTERRTPISSRAMSNRERDIPNEECVADSPVRHAWCPARDVSSFRAVFDTFPSRHASLANPNASRGEPSVSRGRPNVSHGQPNAPHGKPGVSRREPCVSHGRTRASHGKANASPARPDVTRGKPSVARPRRRASLAAPRDVFPRENTSLRTSNVASSGRHAARVSRAFTRRGPKTTPRSRASSSKPLLNSFVPRAEERESGDVRGRPRCGGDTTARCVRARPRVLAHPG
jgi:hypothetical protein